MFTVSPVPGAQFRKIASDNGVTLPIEQTEEWARYQDTVEGRSPWHFLTVNDGHAVVALISLIRYSTHGYHFLRAAHGPVLLIAAAQDAAEANRDSTDAAARESAVLHAVTQFVRRHAPDIVFVRMASSRQLPESHAVLSTVPYDQTVIIDVTGGEDEILSRMKRRGRRDVRKSLRECDAVCADETDLAIADFTPYYEVMKDTGSRDGFAPAPMKNYADMITSLGPAHCRVFAARADGAVVAWSIITVSGTHAVRYYAAMRSDARKMHVTDRLLFAECCELGKQGITEYDLMGIGSGFAPSLMGLNEFKTKFTENITPVPPERDFPIRKVTYSVLTAMQKIRHFDIRSVFANNKNKNNKNTKKG